MDVVTYIFKGFSKAYKKVFHKVYPDNPPDCDYNRESVNARIYRLLINDNPCMISRYGSIEIAITLTYLVRQSNEGIIKKILNYIKDKTELPWIDRKYYVPIARNAGVFNPTPEILEKFAQKYLEDTPLIDLLASVNYKEKFMPLKESCEYVHFETLYPFFVDNPWTVALEGKNILVVHPFAETILSQYSKRDLLFKDPRILPSFNLKCLKAVQSIAGEEVPFNDWFEALNYMEAEIEKIEFDICILGCGAYGLPLAAFVKRLGKKAVHLGGGTQLLFGIKGKRWEENYIWTYNTPVKLDLNYKDLYNEYWVRPSENETPKAAHSVENSCYW